MNHMQILYLAVLVLLAFIIRAEWLRIKEKRNIDFNNDLIDHAYVEININRKRLFELKDIADALLDLMGYLEESHKEDIKRLGRDLYATNYHLEKEMEDIYDHLRLTLERTDMLHKRIDNHELQHETADAFIKVYEADECKPIPNCVRLRVYSAENIKELTKSMEEYKMNPEGKDENGDPPKQYNDEMDQVRDMVRKKEHISHTPCPFCGEDISYFNHIDQGYVHYCKCGKYIYMDIKDELAEASLITNV